MIKILFLAANPKDTESLRLGEEVREIKERLRLADLRDEFEVEQEWALRVSDLQDHLLRHQPEIVHFSGHGSRTGQIVLEGRTGNSSPVSAAALKRLFAALKDNIRCVVLNACYAEAQAQGIVESIDCVIGMTRAITDQSAIAFAAGFYQALGYGRSIQTAFDLGCLQIDLQATDRERDSALNDSLRRDVVRKGRTLPDDDTPKLKVAPGVDPATIYLAGNTSASGSHPTHDASTPAGPAGTLHASAGDTLNQGQHYSCFISYSHRDEHFARKIHSRLSAEGLEVWYAPEDVRGGKKLHDQIKAAIQNRDKLLLVLSEHSMASEWVVTEIRRALKAELKEGKQKLFPIRLVEFDVIRDWECFDADTGKDLGVEIREYFIPDFSNWKDDTTFERSFARLLRDLKNAE